MIEISESVNFCVMEAIKLCRLDTPIIFIEARINLSRFVVTGCAAKTSATVTFPSLNLISLFAFCFNIWLNGRSEERFSRNAETDLVCRLLLEKKNTRAHTGSSHARRHGYGPQPGAGPPAHTTIRQAG